MKRKLKDILSYEQPARYIVASEDYSDEFNTPVLTAGKSFVLGYTNEKDGICEASEDPVIIFDDFTADSKYVDFDFKVKSSAMKILRKRNTKDILKYFFYAMQAIEYTPFSHKRVWISDYSNLTVPYPSSEKQNEIVSRLESVEGMISNAERQLALADELVKSRFIEMFGDPVDNPKHWDTFLLKNLCTKLTDGTHYSPKNYPNGDYLYVTAKNIKPDGFDFTNITYVSREVHDEIYARCNPEYGDVLYIKDGVTTGIAMINTLHEPFSMLSSVALIKYNRNILNGLFLCSVLNDNHMYETIRNSMDGAAITRLTISKLNKIKLPVPPLTLQKQFASFVEQVDKSKLVIKKNLAELEELKNSLMQKYFFD